MHGGAGGVRGVRGVHEDFVGLVGSGSWLLVRRGTIMIVPVQAWVAADDCRCGFAAVGVATDGERLDSLRAGVRSATTTSQQRPGCALQPSLPALASGLVVGWVGARSAAVDGQGSVGLGRARSSAVAVVARGGRVRWSMVGRCASTERPVASRSPARPAPTARFTARHTAAAVRAPTARASRAAFAGRLIALSSSAESTP